MRLIKIEGGTTLVQVDSSQRTLLEELEYQQCYPEYQCRQGFCGNCKLRLLEGSVEYKEEPLAFIRDGYILSCCCYIKSDIKIELN